MKEPAESLPAVTPTSNRFHDMIGLKFNRLTVLGMAEPTAGGRFRLRCVCECGCIVFAQPYDLKRGKHKSCGCYHSEQVSRNNTTYGMSHINGYRLWYAMIKRCTDERADEFHNYGARGIGVCNEWMWPHGFAAFHSDMWPRPAGYSLERRDNNKGYSKENCYWATQKQQMRNTRRNHLLTFNGKTMCIAAWADFTGLRHTIIRNRLIRGWSVEKTLTTPCDMRRSHPKCS